MRGRLQFQVDGPFLFPPIRALRNGTHYGMIFTHTLPTPSRILHSTALGEGEGAAGKKNEEQEEQGASRHYYNGSRSQSGPTFVFSFSFLALSIKCGSPPRLTRQEA